MSDKYLFQNAAVDDAVSFLRSAKPGERRLYASPTGTGKSFMEARVQAETPGSYLVVPSVEIGMDMLAKRGVAREVSAMHGAGIWTPIVLRNRMLAGETPAPKALIIDEAHHHLSETYQVLDLLTGVCPTVGFTATPYRGTPRETSKFRQQWGGPTWVITIPEALRLGVLSFPTLRVIPLVDDDVVEVRNGQFVVSAVDSATGSRLGEVVELIATTRVGDSYDRTSMVSVPSREVARDLHQRCEEAGLPSSLVDGETPQGERQAAFSSCVAGERLLIQIQVVREGVDLPIRRLWDLHPMLSPVEFLQQFGRITRPVKPGEEPPEYIGFNRNLLRHAYLLEGCVPSSVYAAAESAFGGPSKRAGMRAIGLEALGRFAGSEFPLASGATGLLYAVSCFDGGTTTTQYACVVDPLSEDVLWAKKINQRTDDPRKPHYGKWRRCEAPVDLSGFSSLPPSPLTDKQKAWWGRDAKRYGLDPEAKVNRKSFSVLPILADLREKL